MEYEKPIQATPFSKKLMASAKDHPYDGVFVTGRSGKLRSSGAVVDYSDYAEIFRAGSTGCSIPVLDIPETFESASGGGRSSRPVDYSKIFGGLADSTDFGVPVEDLLPPKPNNTRTNPAKTRTRSRGRSRRFSFSEEKQESTRGPPEQPLAGVKEFNVLYNRTDPGSQYGESRTVPVAELHVVNGYSRSVVNGAHFDENAGELPRIPKLSRRAVSGPQPRVAANEASQSYARRSSGRSGSMSKDMFDAFEIGGAAQSSGVRSPSSALSSARDFGGSSRRNMPENKPGNLSPSFSDEEVDVNSVAAASAAAVRKAIEEAQCKIKFAKELMERRKEGRVNFADMNFGNGFKVDKKVARRTGEKLNSSRVKEAQQMNGKEQVSSFFGRMSNHEQIQVSPDLRDNKESSATEASRGLHIKSEEAHGNERVSTRGSRSDDAMKHDLAAVERVVTNSMKNATPSTHEDGFRMNMKTDEKSAELTECLNKTEVNEEDSEQGKLMSQIEVVPKTFQWSFDTNSFKSAQDLEHEEEHASEVRNACDLGEADQAPYVGHEHGQEQMQLDSKQPEVEEREDITDMLECQGDDQYMPEMGEAISGVETTDHETERCSYNRENSGINVVLRETDLINGKPREWESTECQENQKDSSSPEADEYRESTECQENQKDSSSPEADEYRESTECQENQKDSSSPEADEYRESTECQENQKDSSSPEADEYRESNGHWEQDNEMKYVEICEENVIELRSNDLHEEEESDRMAGEHVIRGHDKKETVTMGEQILHVDYQKDMTENQLESSSETDRMHSQTCLSNGDEEEMKVPQQKSIDEDGDADADAIYNHEELEKFMETEEGGWYEETLEGVSVTAERMESPAYANATEESDKEREAGEDANVPVENGFDAVPHPQVFVKLENTIHGSETLETTNNTESAAETDFWSAAETDFWSQQKQGEEHLRGLLDVHDREPYVEEVLWESDESSVDMDESEVGCNKEEYEGNNTISGKVIESHVNCVNPERTDEEVEETMMSSDVEENNVTDEDGEEIAFIHGEEDDAPWSSQDERQTNNHMHAEAAEQFSSSEGVGRMREVSLERKFQCSENIEDSRHKAEEKDVVSESEVGIQNKHNLEKDELREKERQRIIVDRAIKEARERAFADAQERAKRAAADKAVAESRQRETAAANKMPEKAPTEANGKLAADRPTKDAKLKAERAAVERATAEARERALEKALAEKAAAVARSQDAKTAAEKFPCVSREDWAKFRNNRSYDHQHNGKVTSSSLRQPSSSHHAASNPAEKAGASNNVNGSAYWSKATSERHQRTTERAAKALAEKNMRDLLAQREQAERHRLAETLDADVKRWSSGKERSLRALLSTLQYILGPDSGWQPIPLTDLVSTASVKKAYRKATLVVHPDKLQQRGASIQQKYICEKVFDLLKEAWNRFSAEER